LQAEPKRIALMGSTGSIGTQALDIIARYPDKFQVEVLSAGNNIDLLIKQARQFIPQSVVIANPVHYTRLKESLSDLPVKVWSGTDNLDHLVAGKNIDMVIAAMVGYSGLRPTLSAIKAGKPVALANKETLVVAGELIKDAIRLSGSSIIPVDSEHSAILQCLNGESEKSVEKITLTASGGPFLDYPMEKLMTVEPDAALKHPNWDMGNKVTIDSASMMNKGLEVIEAKWLFDLDPDQIDVIIHPQSIIHSFVHFTDGSVKAQLGIPDMRIPILYALSYPERMKSDLPRLDFTLCDSFTFYRPDYQRFRNLDLAYQALRKGGNMPCILNAANEIAVSAFLNKKIGFLQMPELVEYTLNSTSYTSVITMEILGETDTEARKKANEYINSTI
jgi:1-deoxy-D-xylulose-5-phosphate reductoisomerase